MSFDNAMNERINWLIDNNQEVSFVGYYSFLSVRGKEINKTVYFDNVIIKIADFTDSIFATDEFTVYCHKTSFEEASFENVQFHAKATFTKSSFKRYSRREGILHRWGDDYNLKYSYSGYANFSYAEFYDEADFYGSKFDGLVLFYDTKFFDIADFVQTEFNVQNGESPLDNAHFHSTLFDKYMVVGDESIGYA